MKKKRVLFFTIGLLFCVVPPLIATLEYFPLWKIQPDKGLSAFGVIMVLICMLPLWKYIKRALRSPSAWQVWLVILVFCLLMRTIIDEMIVIGYVAVPSSLIGAAFFAWSKKDHSVGIASERDSQERR